MLPEEKPEKPRKAKGIFSKLFGLSLKEAEMLLIEETITRCGGNKTSAAKILGVTDRTLRNKLNGK